jgi:anhydro-N-acetylmuramic acid kinase
MGKIYTAIGLMSGTSLDGVDASIIRSDGEKIINIEKNQYFRYKSNFQNLLRDFIKACGNKSYIQKNFKTYKALEEELTLNHIKISEKILSNCKFKIDLIGFHGQTIIHKPKKGYSIQMGNAHLLSKILKKKVVYRFRKKDIENKGQGAPLASIYHYSLSKKIKIKKPIIFLNIGGISNITFINKNEIYSQDIGPGNVFMDDYINKEKNKKFDKDGYFASKGKINKLVTTNYLQKIENKIKKIYSFDKKDFDYSFINKLSFEDGMATLTYITARIISNYLKKYNNVSTIILCGGGRKNKILINYIKILTLKKIKNIDDYGIDGDFIESQAFGYLAIRSFLNKKITFPNTTRVIKPLSGGELINNY